MFEEFLRLWEAMDRLFERYEEHPWGAIVTDRRFPEVHDANYARVEVGAVSLQQVMDALLPRIDDVGAREIHVVMTNPDASTELIAALSTAGHRLGWDQVMVHEREPAATPSVEIEDLPRDRDFGRVIRDAIAVLGDDTQALPQLVQLERDVFTDDIKRWRCVREDHEIAALAALVMLEGIGYIDNVATFKGFRGKGYASALVLDALARASAMGIDMCFLLVDPRGPVRLYERLGFKTAGRLASTLKPRV